MNYYQANTVVTLNWHKVVRGSGFSKLAADLHLISCLTGKEPD